MTARPPDAEKPLGLVALVRWAWGAYREAKALGLLRRDPVFFHQRRMRRNLQVLFGLGISGSMIFVSLGAGRYLGASPVALVGSMASLTFLLMSCLLPAASFGEGLHSFTRERRSGTLNALVMVSRRREVLLTMRIVAVFKETTRAWFWTLPGYATASVVAGAHLELVPLAAFSWLLLFVLSFALAVHGTVASVQFRSIARAVAQGWTLIFPEMILVVVPLGALIRVIVSTRGRQGMDEIWLVAALLGGVALASALKSLYVLRRAARKFDAWALRD